jgi:hypothetical protein
MITRRNLFLGSAAVILTPGVLMPVRKVWALPHGLTLPERLEWARYQTYLTGKAMTAVISNDGPGLIFVDDWLPSGVVRVRIEPGQTAIITGRLGEKYRLTPCAR